MYSNRLHPDLPVLCDVEGPHSSLDGHSTFLVYDAVSAGKSY